MWLGQTPGSPLPKSDPVQEDASTIFPWLWIKHFFKEQKLLEMRMYMIYEKCGKSSFYIYWTKGNRTGFGTAATQ